VPPSTRPNLLPPMVVQRRARSNGAASIVAPPKRGHGLESVRVGSFPTSVPRVGAVQTLTSSDDTTREAPLAEVERDGSVPTDPGDVTERLGLRSWPEGAKYGPSASAPPPLARERDADCDEDDDKDVTLGELLSTMQRKPAQPDGATLTPAATRAAASSPTPALPHSSAGRPHPRLPSLGAPTASVSAVTAAGRKARPAAGQTTAAAGGDPYQLQRFTRAHANGVFEAALEEIHGGRKRGHWSWFVFPTAPWIVNGVERGSGTNIRYALRDLPPHTKRGDEAARAFLRFPTVAGVNLRRNFLAMMTAILEQLTDHRGTLLLLVGRADDPKVRSSLRLFERISRDGIDLEVHCVTAACLAAAGEPLDP
jgi:uncharacterized protein (DUF1810 family)